MNGVLATSYIFGLTVSESVVLLGVLAYVVSLFRDWRPIRTLRAENHGLREDLDKSNRRIAELEHKCLELEARPDLRVLQEEHRAIVETLARQSDALERIAKHLDHLDHSVTANTAAVELVAKTRAIVEALETERPRT